MKANSTIRSSQHFTYTFIQLLTIEKCIMSKQFTMIYWQSEKFSLGKLKEYPEIMTQGETLQELEENIRDALGEMIEITACQLNIKEAKGFLKGIDTDIEREPDRI